MPIHTYMLKKSPTFKVGDNIRISKYKFQIYLKKFLSLQKLKILCRGHMWLVALTFTPPNVINIFYCL